MDLLHASLSNRTRLVEGFEKHLSETSLENYREHSHVDAHAILRVVRGDPQAFGLRSKDASTARQLANSLIQFRNRWAHQMPLNDSQTLSAGNDLANLLSLLGLTHPATCALNLVLDADGTDINVLRNYLVERAVSADCVVTYEQALDDFGWEGEGAHNRLIRALNGLGGWQKAIGEPALSALVVLAPGRAREFEEPYRPGRGFYWLVGLPLDASLTEKRNAHEAEIIRVLGYPWKAV
jgi:hypothetical protein